MGEIDVKLIIERTEILTFSGEYQNLVTNLLLDFNLALCSGPVS